MILGTRSLPCKAAMKFWKFQLCFLPLSAITIPFRGEHALCFGAHNTRTAVEDSVGILYPRFRYRFIWGY